MSQWRREKGCEVPAFAGICHVGLSAHTTTGENRGWRTEGGIAVLSPRYEVPACAGMTEGERGHLFSKQ